MIEVREATGADVEGIRQVASEGWHAAYGSVMAESTIESVLAEYYARETVERAVASDECVYLVAVDGTGSGPVVGYAAGSGAEADPETAILSAIYVRPGRWGEGVGGALFETLRDRLRGRGFDRVRATVLVENDAGRPFYEARGFEQVGEREERVGGESHRALVVERSL